MNDSDFLALVRKKGHYESSGEASRAANAVFGTIKTWMTPKASDRLRAVLPVDASRLWQYSPVASISTPARRVDGEAGTAAGTLHFLLWVQQLGRYRSWRDARRATCSVLGALSGTLDPGPELALDEMIPGDVLGDCASDNWPMLAGLQG